MSQCGLDWGILVFIVGPVYGVDCRADLSVKSSLVVVLSASLEFFPFRKSRKSVLFQPRRHRNSRLVDW